MSLTISSLFGQMKVTDGNGKSVQTPGMNNSSLKLVLNVPSEIGNHEIIQFTAQIISKTKNHNENYILNTLADGIFVKEFKPDFLKSKSTVTLNLVQGDEKSDFSYAHFTGERIYFNPKSRLTDRTDRAERYYDLVIGIYGKDVESYKYVNDGVGNMVQEPVYKFTELAQYKVDYDGGEVSEFIKSTFGTMILPKVDLNAYDLWRSPPGDVSALNFGANNKYQLKGEDEFVYKTSAKTGEEYFYIRGYTTKASNTSIEEIKEKVWENLVNDANKQKSNYQSTFNSSDVIHSHELCFTTTTANTTDQNESAGGFKAKLKEFKTAMTTPTTFTDEMRQQKRIQAESVAKFTPAKIGNINCEKIEIEVYTDAELRYNDAAKIRDLNPEKAGNKHLFELYVGQAGDKIFVVWMYKPGKNPILSEREMAFRKKFLTEFAII